MQAVKSLSWLPSSPDWHWCSRGSPGCNIERTSICRLACQSARRPVVRGAQTLVQSSLQTSHPEWSRIRVRGDGNCLFRALAQGSHRLSAGSENALPEAEERQAAAQLRRAICEELRNHQADIEPFLEGNFGAYVRRMESEATWGGEPELAVAPHCLQRPINVFTQRLLGPLEQISSYGDQYKPAAALAGPCQAAAQDRSQADLDRSFQMAQGDALPAYSGKDAWRAQQVSDKLQSLDVGQQGATSWEVDAELSCDRCSDLFSQSAAAEY
ncbi:hypothetical protein WJX74_000254 [Apatococcus lobatus]|uniref:OTU domain-containing protein n=1 Tax=Apatococcus lobatus TaxID=904363 RepID=A0AAW1QUR5_9CHLO